MTADIILVRSNTLIGKLIRFFSQPIGKKPAKVNHVALMRYNGTVIEALDRVRVTDLSDKIGQDVAVYRVKSLTPVQREIVSTEAIAHLGQKYGYLKIVAHLLDWCLFGAYFFRRIARMPNYPICSWLVADAYKEVQWDFGVPMAAAEPDDIWVHIQNHPQDYECIRPLSKYVGGPV